MHQKQVKGWFKIEKVLYLEKFQFNDKHLERVSGKYDRVLKQRFSRKEDKKQETDLHVIGQEMQNLDS